MAYQSKRMEEVRQIISAYLKTSKYKVVARQLGISKNTVRKYLRLVERVDLPKEDLLRLEDEDLKTLIYPAGMIEESERIQTFTSLVDYWLSELRRIGVTRQLLWQEYRADHPDGLRTVSFVRN